MKKNNILIFIEFYGLPGSGKSTLSHIMAERLRSEAYSVEEPSYDIDHLQPLPKRAKKLATCGYWFVFHHNQYRRAGEIVKQNGYHGITAFKQISNVIQKMRIYNNKTSADIIFMDQGLIQACVSLSMNGVLSAKDNYERLLCLMPNAAKASRIYVEVNDEVAIDRMNKRVTNDSRVEKLKEHAARVEMLRQIREEIVSFREQCLGNGNEHIIFSSNNLMNDADNTYDAIKEFLTERK